MNRRLLLQLAAALSLTLASILAIAVAARADTSAGKGAVEVREPFARATIGPATSGVVYLTLVNHASSPDRLTGAATPAAARTDLHITEHEGDIARMRRMETVPIPAGEAVAFSPGGAHIMLSGLEAPLHEGDSFSLTLEFEHAGALTVEVPVRSFAAGAGTGDDSGAHGVH